MTIKRVHYREDQRLKQEDLQDEQAYQIAARRRHNIAHHGWGIVDGLELVPDVPGVAGIVVNPGFAIDGYGRELIVPEAMILDENVFDQLQDDSVGSEHPHYFDIWLTYCLRQLAINPDGSDSREAEEALLKINCTSNDNVVDPRYPWEVSQSDLDFQPHRDAPDDPELEWPVYLGRIKVDSNSFYLEHVFLHYASLTGATIRSAWGTNWLQLGSEEQNDGRRFALSFVDAKSAKNDSLAINENGEIDLFSNVNLFKLPNTNIDQNGNLIIEETDDPSSDVRGVFFEGCLDEPQLSAPWQIYKTNMIETVNQQELNVNQLRFETFNPGDEGEPARYELRMGVPNGSDFYPGITVRSDNKVLVHHNLVVKGQIIEGAIPFNLEDRRFRDSILSKWTDGLTVAGTEVEAYYDILLELQTIKIGVIRIDSEGKEQTEYLPYPYDPFSREDEVFVELTIKNNSINRNIPILAVIAEFRNAERRVIYSEAMTGFTDVLKSGFSTDAKTTRFTFEDKNILGSVTLEVRVFSLSVSRNRVESQTSTVIKVT